VSCNAIVPKTAVIVFIAMIEVIAMKLAKFLIAKSLKLGHRYLISMIMQRQCSDGIMVPFCVVAALQCHLIPMPSETQSIENELA